MAIEREVDGLGVAEVPGVLGVMAPGELRQQALGKAQALSVLVLAERPEQGEGMREYWR